MSHLQPDRLVLLAFGESLSDETESAHLSDCGTCGAEIESLRRARQVGAETEDVRDLPAPPDRIWRRISAELGAAGGTGPIVAPTPPPAPAASDLRPWRPRRWPAWTRTVVAAAAAAVLAIGGTLAATRLADRDTTPAAPAVTARASLTALPDAPATATGTAQVLADNELHLHVTGLPLGTGYYEVWLIDPDTRQMISLGTLGTGADETLPLPATVNLRAYRLVDVSAEKYDGKTAHSGMSMLRGVLTD